MSDKYIGAEMQLAKLLGWKSIEQRSTWIESVTANGTFMVPQWSRDNAAAFELMVLHEIDIDWAVDAGAVRAYVNTNEAYLYREVAIADHFDKEAAVRFAIVQAVIAKLESGISSKS